MNGIGLWGQMDLALSPHSTSLSSVTPGECLRLSEPQVFVSKTDPSQG